MICSIRYSFLSTAWTISLILCVRRTAIEYGKHAYDSVVNFRNNEAVDAKAESQRRQHEGDARRGQQVWANALFCLAA
jgi:hypothetical protein